MPDRLARDDVIPALGPTGTHVNDTGLIIVLGTLLLLLAACSTPQDEERSSQGESEEMETPGMMDEGMMDGMPGSMPGWMMSRGMMQGMMADMRVIHGLLTRHERIEREVEDIPGGVRTVTTSVDPEIAEQIRTHVRQMEERMEKGEAIRQMDPLFRELFDHHEEIHMEYEEIPGGVRVTETSDNPEVVALIRQHAHAFVNEVVEQGMQRAMQPTPLPEEHDP